MSQITPNTSAYYLLYCLYHHDVSDVSSTLGYSAEDLYEASTQPASAGVDEIVQVLRETIIGNVMGSSARRVSLTLTGGLDSRLILAFLLSEGIRPNCLCYGDPRTADVRIARQLAEGLGLGFHNPRWSEIGWKWYLQWVRKTIELDSGRSHLHRAHRTAAIDEHASIFQPEVLYTGHMGGEGIRGLTYNNYFASPYFERINEGDQDKREAAEEVLKDYFIRDPAGLINECGLDFDFITWEGRNSSRNKFFFLYDMVGKVHHSQDLRLYGHYVDRVISPFLDEAYLKVLFSSPFHMMSRREGLLGRLSNRKLYCMILERVYPELLKVPLANGYLPADYLRGAAHYLPKKLLHSLRSRSGRVPGFSYGKWYVEFVRECSRAISDDVWEHFDREEYMRRLKDDHHGSSEGYWHRFSNPIFFSMTKNHLDAGAT